MLQGRLAARNRVLLSMILPVLVVGLTIIAASAHFWTIPVITYIEERARTELEIASDLGIMRCEDRLNDLIILRLDENPGMVESVKKWTIKEVLAIADRLPDIHIMIIENKTILGSSETGLEWQPPILSRGGGIISTAEIHGEAVRFHYRYFPVWNWHIVSFIHEKDFMEPISSANRTVYAISMGVLLLVSAAILFIFERMVNSPLKRIINAARGIAQGRYTMLRIRRQDEIGQVAHAFDTMVKSLEDDKEWIHAILSKLKESEERYRLLTENSLANIIMIQGGRLIYANRTTTATSGYSADELYRMEILDLIHPDDCDLVREKVFGGMNSEKMVPDRYEFRYLTKQGETRWLEMLSVPSLYRGQPAMLGHAIDITDSVIARQEQNKLEEKLIQAQKMEALGTIVGAVAHDLNNILAGLVGYPDLLLLQLPQGSPLRKYVGAIQQSGQRAAAIVQDLLTMVRRGVIVKEVVSLNQIILSYMLSPEFERLKSDNPRVEFRTDLEPDLLNISGSR
ncbi:MAG: PAS domain S-box protein, partial [Syntrophobacteraceae bacterium]